MAEPAPHGADAGHRGVVEGMQLAKPRDCGEDAFAPRETLLGLAPEPRPRVGPWPAPCDAAPEGAYRCKMRVKRTRARACHTAVRVPDPHERDDKVPPRIRAHERDGMVPFAEPDSHSVSEFSLKSLATSPIEANRADRALDRDISCLVERRKSCHAVSLPEGVGTRLCRADTGWCRSPKWHWSRVSLGCLRQANSLRRLEEPLTRSRARLLWRPGRATFSRQVVRAIAATCASRIPTLSTRAEWHSLSVPLGLHHPARAQDERCSQRRGHVPQASGPRRS